MKLWSFSLGAFVGVFLTSKAIFWRENGILTVSAEGEWSPVHMEKRTKFLPAILEHFNNCHWAWGRGSELDVHTFVTFSLGWPL